MPIVELAQSLCLYLHIIKGNVEDIHSMIGFGPGTNRIHGITRIYNLDIGETAIADSSVAHAKTYRIAVGRK